MCVCVRVCTQRRYAFMTVCTIALPALFTTTSYGRAAKLTGYRALASFPGLRTKDAKFAPSLSPVPKSVAAQPRPLRRRALGIHHFTLPFLCHHECNEGNTLALTFHPSYIHGLISAQLDACHMQGVSYTGLIHF